MSWKVRELIGDETARELMTRCRGRTGWDIIPQIGTVACIILLLVLVGRLLAG